MFNPTRRGGPLIFIHFLKNCVFLRKQTDFNQSLDKKLFHDLFLTQNFSKPKYSDHQDFNTKDHMVVTHIFLIHLARFEKFKDMSNCPKIWNTEYSNHKDLIIKNCIVITHIFLHLASQVKKFFTMSD